jgi:hypothetical protein
MKYGTLFLRSLLLAYLSTPRMKTVNCAQKSEVFYYIPWDSALHASYSSNMQSTVCKSYLTTSITRPQEVRVRDQSKSAASLLCEQSTIFVISLQLKVSVNIKCSVTEETKLNPLRANYTDRATAACRRS